MDTSDQPPVLFHQYLQHNYKIFVKVIFFSGLQYVPTLELGSLLR